MTKRKSTFRNLQLFLLSSALILLAVLKTQAGGPVVWETSSRAELLNGESHGVSVTDTGALMLAPQLTQLFDTAQAFVWSSAADAAGEAHLSTGRAGPILLVSPDRNGPR